MCCVNVIFENYIFEILNFLSIFFRSVLVFMSLGILSRHTVAIANYNKKNLLTNFKKIRVVKKFTRIISENFKQFTKV